ncbi:MAG: hypothetical protein HRT83_04875 [Hyphomicrobiaceae bacterium]|nr:hypothetical protein [Hyphomicrobiaceae bacterium]
MATNSAAAFSSIRNKFVRAASLAIISTTIASCSAGNDSLLQAFTSPLADKSSALQPERLVTVPRRGDIAIAPLIGPPASVSTKLTTQVGAELAKKSIRMVLPYQGGVNVDQSSNYTLRGYVVAASEGEEIKLSYIWDVTGVSGKRVHRIKGEDVIKRTASNDPWSSVSAQTLTKIAKFAANGISKWWPQQSFQRSSALIEKLASAKSSAQSKILQAADRSLVGKKNALAFPELAIHVSQVKGAPGDGSTSLSKALQRQLLRSGLTLVESPAKAAHTIQGNVKVGVVQSGRQPIKIDWVVKNSVGKKLGTVSQKNRIPAGSLDNQWGATADAAASAAAKGIIQLLPLKS